jgi:hypothetical protein
MLEGRWGHDFSMHSAPIARGTTVAAAAFGRSALLETTPAHRAFLAVALALTACGPPPGEIEEQEGTLGNGAFFYYCVSWQDPACAAVEALDPDTTLPFPSTIAYGGTFQLAYGPSEVGLNGQPYQPDWGDELPAPVSSDWLVAADAGVFTATRAGRPWMVVVDDDGGLKDMLPVDVAPISSITFHPAKPAPPMYATGPTPAAGPNVVGGMLTMAATARDASGDPMGGDVLYSWASSDPSVLGLMGDLGSPSDTVTVQFLAAGTATLYAWTSTVQGTTTLTVTGESSADGGAP